MHEMPEQLLHGVRGGLSVAAQGMGEVMQGIEFFPLQVQN